MTLTRPTAFARVSLLLLYIIANLVSIVRLLPNVSLIVFLYYEVNVSH